MSDKFQTTELARRMLNYLPKLDPKIAIVMSRYASGETTELIRRLNEVNIEVKDNGSVTPV